jgi:DNA processing protein
MRNLGHDVDFKAVSILEETVAYEALVAELNRSIRSVSEQLRVGNMLPSDLLRTSVASLFTEQILEAVRTELLDLSRVFSVALYNDVLYPAQLRFSEMAPSLLYYLGDIELCQQPLVSVVGARKATDDGRKLAAEIARTLTNANFCVTSGLAAGIDTSAMHSAIEAGGKVVGVIGTPLNQSYPKENNDLQKYVSQEGLLVSQVPFFRYSREHFSTRKYHFPQRNELMAGITRATVIVEASDTSGTLTQARACMKLSRPLFITERCYHSQGISWPKKYVEKGAIVVKNSQEILEHLTKSSQ